MGAASTEKVKIFTAEQSYVKRLLDNYNISPQITRIGVITYGKSFTRAVALKQKLDVSTLRSIIDSLQNPGDGNRIDLALEAAFNDFISNGARLSATKSVVLFIDTMMMGDKEMLNNILAKLKSSEIKFNFVGIGKDVDISELKAIFSSPENVIAVDDITQFNGQGDVLSHTLPGKIF